MCSGAASSDWAGGGDDGVLGAEPNGESGVVCLLAHVAARVEVGLGTEVSCGVAAGVDRASAGADGPASSGAAAGLASLPCIYLLGGMIPQLFGREYR
ncbi:hypothetical protein V6N11_056153 [Hibiscus sabdariffa]|uniref:Uncharacterized protein n=1 Tax=Hibiscus sabdariffa TaxID=183260 RepID=A0ABR2T3V1_9ROSI